MLSLCYSSLFNCFYCHPMVLSVKVQLKSNWADQLFDQWTNNAHMTMEKKKREMANERLRISETKGLNRQAESKPGRTSLPQSITSIMYEWPDENWFPTELFEALSFIQDNNPFQSAEFLSRMSSFVHFDIFFHSCSIFLAFQCPLLSLPRTNN